jgi:NifU-like protein involved in Fe-S cluster formation
VNAAPKLYTPEILGLATRLGEWPLADDLPLRASARSTTCGSTIELGIELDAQNRIWRCGLQVTACAMGQASSTLFAQDAIGKSALEVRAMAARMEQWLAGTGPQPDWRNLDLLDRARDYPARHGAIMLPWKAAKQALSPAASAD